MQPWFRPCLLALGLAAAAAVGGESARAGINPEAARHVSRGEALAQARQWKEAQREFDLAIQVNSRYAPALAARARTHLALDHADLALADAGEALRLDPACPDARIVRAEVLIRRRQFDSAREDLTAVIRACPNHSRAYLVRGKLHNELSMFAHAVADFNHHLKVINANDAAVLGQRGLAYFRMGDQGAALADFNQAINLDKKDPENYYLRGLIHEMQGRLAEALEDFRRVLKERPGDLNARFRHGHVHYRMQNWAESVADFDAYLARSPEEHQARLYRAHACLQMGWTERALADYEILLEQSPGDSTLVFHRATALSRLDRHGEAIQGFTQLVAGDPSIAGPALVSRAKVYRQLGDDEKAMRDLDTAILTVPSYIHALTQRASLNISLDRFKEAQADYEKALRANKTRNTTAAYCRILSLTLGGKLDEGEKEAEAAAQTNAKSADWLYDLACAYAITAEAVGKMPGIANRSARALRYKERALELLERAVACGYRDFVHMKRDPDFLVLRQEPRFKKLAESAAAAAGPMPAKETR